MKWIFVAAITLFFVACLWGWAKHDDECLRAGGVLVRGVVGLECVKSAAAK